MPVTVPVTIKAAPLPVNFKGKPQALLDAFIARMSLETSLNAVSLVAGGSIAPTSNVGPWLKDGTTWYIWSDSTGSYVPISLDYQSLKYVASTTAPDPNIYTLWIVLDSAGKAQEIRYFSGGLWQSVYDDSFKALIAQVDVVESQFPFRGDSAADQILLAAGDAANVVFTETFDPGNVFGASAFVAPEDGYYLINLKVNMETSGGSPTANTVIVWLTKNNVNLTNEFDTHPIVDGNTGQCTYKISTILKLSANDSIKAYVECSATGAGNWIIKQSGTYISGHRVFTYMP